MNDGTGKKTRVLSARQAISYVASGQTVFLGSGCGEPQALVEALVADHARLSHVNIVTGIQGSKTPYVAPELAPHFRLRTFMPSRGVRDAIRDGYADYVPVPLSQIPRLFRERVIPLDVAMIQVSPPNDEGQCSLGVSVAYAKAASESAVLVIAEMNARMPRTLGGAWVPISDIDIIVESDRPVLEVPAARQDAELTAIGRNVAGLVPDGATVQVGVGGIAEAVWKALEGHRDLGIHSGSLPDAVVDLVGRGVITNRRKTLDRGRIVAGQLIATRKLYDFAHDNPLFDMRPCDYTHDPSVLARHDRLVSVNSAVEVDLRGQVNAESLGGQQVAGVGGAIDFTVGAVLAPSGRSIVALPATARRGIETRIVAQVDGGVVTSPCSLIDFVVTEHGVAELRGKSLCERARALIAIADPKFREELGRAASARAPARVE